MCDEGRQASGVFGIARDITARKNAEDRVRRQSRIYAALSQCNQAVVHCSNEDELFARICRNAVDFGGMLMAWVGVVAPDTRRVLPVAQYGEGTEYLDEIESSADAASPYGQGATGIAVRAGQPVWIQDFMNDARTAPWHERGRHFGWGQWPPCRSTATARPSAR